MRTIVLPAVLLAAAGCSFFTVPFECDDSLWEPGQTCDAVLEAARAELPPSGEIESLRAVQGIHCPPAAYGCPNVSSVVTVYADLVDGRQQYVSVELARDGSLTARPAEAVEPEP